MALPLGFGRSLMRYSYLILFALLLGLPFGIRWATVREESRGQLTAGAARLVVVTPHTGDIRREFSLAFDQWHRKTYGTSVLIDYRVPGGTTDMVKLLADKHAAGVSADFDVIWGGGDYTFYHDLQPKGILQPIHLSPSILREAFPNDSLAGVRLYDSTTGPDGKPAPRWIGTCLSSFGIVYNPELYTALNMPPPTAWQDLADPRLVGLVALADPAHSGSAAVAYMMVIQRAMADAEEELFSRDPQLKALPRAELRKRSDYQVSIAQGWRRGMGQLLLIAANARYFTDSSPIVPNDVGSGEAAAGMAIDFYARVTEGTVGRKRARFVAPRAATAITPDPVAIAYGVSGERLVLATHFIEFLLTPEAQRLWILLPGQPGGPIERSPRRMPIRRDIYTNQSGWADHFNPFEEAGDFNQRGEWMALMSDTRMIWDAGWIDSRDALLAAYQTVLNVPDDARRRRLLAELADVPVQMRDVEMLRIQRAAIEQAHGDVNEFNVRQRLQWGGTFRRHYDRLAREARQ